MSAGKIRVTVWNEGRHEQRSPEVAALYPKGIHGALADHLNRAGGFEVRTGMLDDSHHGLDADVVSQTDVMLWWGHLHHQEVADEIVERVHQRVLAGMGLIVLHSGHFSKIFKRLMGTSCDLKWRVSPNEREILWVSQPGHPIVAGIDDHFILEHEEMYGEFFDIPQPESTFFISSFTGGEVFRSGCTWTRGAGKVVYFRPGHETFGSYHDKNVLRVIENAARWAAPNWPEKPVTFGKRVEGWLDQG
jgi:trehalose utilization protein